MCQTNCPSKCITIEAGERLDGVEEKIPVRFDIDLLACIYCGYCVEACPKDAIRMDSGIFAVVDDNRESMIIGIEELMATPGAFAEEDYQREDCKVWQRKFSFGFLHYSPCSAVWDWFWPDTR